MYLVRRLVESLLALWLASVIVFIGARSLPGDPAIALSGEGFDPAANQQIRQKYGLDQPLPLQYIHWLSLAARGNLGRSIRTGLDVTQTMMNRLPITLELASLSILITILLGLPTGMLSAVRRGGLLDYLANVTALFGLSVPPFWIGLLLILVVASMWQLLPASGYAPFALHPIENLRRMIMPAFVLGSGFAAVVMRQARSAMVESLASDYVRTARAKGLSDRTRHVCRRYAPTEERRLTPGQVAGAQRVVRGCCGRTPPRSERHTSDASHCQVSVLPRNTLRDSSKQDTGYRSLVSQDHAGWSGPGATHRMEPLRCGRKAHGRGFRGNRIKTQAGLSGRIRSGLPLADSLDRLGCRQPSGSGRSCSPAPPVSPGSVRQLRAVNPSELSGTRCTDLRGS